MSFKNQYKKKFNKTFNNFNPRFNSQEYLELKLDLERKIPYELSMLDDSFDEESIDEQRQINKELLKDWWDRDKI